jgi:iron complex transport system substrate-binding protein
MPKLLAALLLLLALAPARADAPRRVVSLNLCADQLLLALADPAQIASVTFLARDPELSFLAAEAASVPVNGGSGEAILLGGADLVLVGAYDGRARRDLLARQGVPTLQLDPWRDLKHGQAQIRAVAARLGHPERGERLLADIDAALAGAKDAASAPRTVLVLNRRGWVPGVESVVGDVLRQAGLTLAQERLGLAGGGLARLEHLVSAPPDYAVMGDFDLGDDQGAAFLAHPALRSALPPERRLRLPGRLTLCEGPSTPALIDHLAAEIRAKVR